MSEKERGGGGHEGGGHEGGCGHPACASCGGSGVPNAERVAAVERAQIEKHGWMFWYVPDAGGGLADIHTVGLADGFGHPEVQIVYPLSPPQAHGILWAAFRAYVEKGERIPLGVPLDGILGRGFRPQALWARRGGGPAPLGRQPVVRLVLPDPGGDAGPQAAHPYRRQHEGTLGAGPHPSDDCGLPLAERVAMLLGSVRCALINGCRHFTAEGALLADEAAVMRHLGSGAAVTVDTSERVERTTDAAQIELARQEVLARIASGTMPGFPPPPALGGGRPRGTRRRTTH